VLVARNYQAGNLVRLLPASVRTSALPEDISRSEAWRVRARVLGEAWAAIPPVFATPPAPEPRDQVLSEASPEANDPLYLFACQVEWEQSADPSAAWDVISAARSSHAGTRAHAMSLLERSQQMKPQPPQETPVDGEDRGTETLEAGMRTPYGLEIIESCMGCKASRDGFFCRFSPTVLRSVDEVSHHTIMPAGALLFVEGQTPRGVFVVCSGKVKLYTTSKEGKVLILKQAEAGEVLGLSAAISGTNYEMTAETAVPCQLDYIGRQDFIALLQKQSEVGVHATLSLSREFQAAYRDIHDLVLARSSSGKLARLLLSSSCAPRGVLPSEELRLRSVMTHEEMAQRIGASRETVTRLLSDLKKKRLIRLEGANLVIRNRSGLEALAV
jgi:CRP/FNR family transcriptional regulator, cyclic AMP receptor protein